MSWKALERPDILSFNLGQIPSEAMFSVFGILVNVHNKKWLSGARNFGKCFSYKVIPVE